MGPPAEGEDGDDRSDPNQLSHLMILISASFNALRTLLMSASINALGASATALTIRSRYGETSP
jgi:hypothetical protein